jgi:hypothetical protein
MAADLDKILDDVIQSSTSPGKTNIFNYINFLPLA